MTQADGATVWYAYDGFGRRIGKRVDGVLAEANLCDGQRLIAQLDGRGAVVARFGDARGAKRCEWRTKTTSTLYRSAEPN